MNDSVKADAADDNCRAPRGVRCVAWGGAAGRGLCDRRAISFLRGWLRQRVSVVEVVDVSESSTVAEQITQIAGAPEVDCAVNCVGFEARGHGKDASHEAPATVLNSLMEITGAGGALGIPGLYVTGDPGGIDANAKVGNLSIRIGLGWAKSHVFTRASAR